MSLRTTNRSSWTVVIAFVIAAGLIGTLLWRLSTSKRKQSATVPQLALLAQYGDKRAAETLQHLGPEAVPELIKSLQTRDSYLRVLLWQNTNAPVALRRKLAKRIPPPDAVMYRESAALALGWLGSNAAPAIEPLLVALTDKYGTVSIKAATALAKIGPASVPGLVRLLSHEDPHVRIAAMGALSKLRGEAGPAVPELLKTLRQPEPIVQDTAVETLSSIGPPAVPALAQAIRSDDPYMREKAIKALQLMGMPIKLVNLRWANPATVDALASLLDDPAPEVKFGALRLLNFLPGKAKPAEPGIHALTNDPDQKVAELARSIAKRGRK